MKFKKNCKYCYFKKFMPYSEHACMSDRQIKRKDCTVYVPAWYIQLIEWITGN